MSDETERDAPRGGEGEAGRGGTDPEERESATGEAEPGRPSAAGRPPASRETEDERLLQTADRSVGRRRYDVLGPDAWRVFRIMGEFVEGFEEMALLGPAVSFFGSARATPDEPMYQKCVETARRMGEAGFCVITGGGPGMMEAANRGAREAGVQSVGCNIELPFEQATNPFVDLAVDFRYFFVRKMMFVKYAKAFVIFPGGFGTMDELFEALTLIQTGKIRSFPVVLFGRDYWGGLLEWTGSTVLAQGRIAPEDLDLFVVTDSPEEAAAHVAERSDGSRSRVPEGGEGARRPD